MADEMIHEMNIESVKVACYNYPEKLPKLPLQALLLLQWQKTRLSDPETQGERSVCW